MKSTTAAGASSAASSTAAISSATTCWSGNAITIARWLWGAPSLPLPPSPVSLPCEVFSLPVDVSSFCASCCKRPSASSKFSADASSALPFIPGLPVPFTGAACCMFRAITFALFIRLTPPLKLCIEKKDGFLKLKLESVPVFCHFFFILPLRQRPHLAGFLPAPVSQCPQPSEVSSWCPRR